MKKKKFLSLILIIGGVLALLIFIYFRVFSVESRIIISESKMEDFVPTFVEKIPMWKQILDFFFSYLKEAMSVVTSGVGIWLLIKNNRRKSNG